MKNLKLTTKSEVLSYLENQRVHLVKEEIASKCATISFFAGMVINSLACGKTISALSAGFVVASGPISSTAILCGIHVFFTTASALATFAGYSNSKLCKYKLQETEKKIGWIKDGTFIRNTIDGLEMDVVNARERKTPMTKSR